MKKFYILLLSFLWVFGFSQNPDLLNTEWKITKFVGELSPTEQLPPSMPYQQVTKFETSPNRLNLSFFNMLSADVSFNGQNSFTVSNKTCTLADYLGDNGQVNQFFGLLCSFFAINGNYFYTIENNGNEKTLIISNAIFQSIYFKSAILSVKNNALKKSNVFPNPVSDFLKIENLKPNSNMEIVDSSGKLVKSISGNSSDKTEINVRNLTPGIYYLKINGESVQKIIKK